MLGMIRFHLDENVSSVIADGLRRRGIDVSTTPVGTLNFFEKCDRTSQKTKSDHVFTPVRNHAFGFVVECDLLCSSASLSLIRLSSSSAFELSSCNVAKDN